MRSSLLLFLLLLASCASGRDTSFSTKSPGLDVGQVALSNGAPDTALRIAQKALLLNSRNVAALVLQANAEAALGQREQSERSFAEALATAPNDAEATIGLGRLKLASDAAAAADLFRRVSIRDPRNVAALVDLGIAADLLGRHGEAQTAYRRALEIEPSRLAAHANLGLSLALSGDPQQAVRILRPLAQEPGASSRIRQDLAVALAICGSDSEAASILNTEIPQPAVLAALASYRLLQSQPVYPVPN